MKVATFRVSNDFFMKESDEENYEHNLNETMTELGIVDEDVISITPHHKANNQFMIFYIQPENQTQGKNGRSSIVQPVGHTTDPR